MRQLVVTAVFSALSMAAQAAPVAISNAAYAATYVRDCRSSTNFTATPDRCEVGGGFVVGQGPGGGPPSTLKELRESMALGGTSASTAATLGLGIAATGSGPLATQSAIDVSGVAGTLLLRQAAASGSSYSRVSGHSLGLQSFLFSGATGEVRTIENVFDFVANVTPNLDLNTPGATGSIYDPVVYAKTRVTVFSLSTASFLFDDVLGLEVQNAGFRRQADGLLDYRLEGEINDRGITTSGRTTRLGFTMTSGRYYFVESYLGLWARFGGWIDATHTFSNTLGRTDSGGAFIADASGFTAAAPLQSPVVSGSGSVTQPHAVVSSPGTLACVLLALSLLGALRSRTTA